ncbi:hypothetical protein ACSXAY_10285 [Clostridium perfringens]
MAKKELIKKVRFDFTNDGNIAFMHVDAECEDTDDFKEAMEFVKETSKELPTNEDAWRGIFE